MSYRNPQQVVDTQSGQHIRNLQKTIAGVAVDVIDTFSKEEKVRKAKEEADNKEWDRLQKIQSDNEINAGNSYNKGAQSNFFSLESTGVALNGFAKTVAELKAKANLTPQEKIEYTNLMGLSSTLKDGMTTIGSQVGTIGVDLENIGTMGGAARGQGVRGGKFAMGMNNQIPGKKWFDVDNSREGGSQITYHFQEEGSDDIISYTSQQLKDLQNATGASMYHKIPNESKRIEKLVNEGSFWKVQDGAEVRSLKEEYYTGGEITTEIVNGVEITYQAVNKDSVLKDLFTGSQGNTSGMAPNDQVSFNNYLNEQLGIDKNENIAYGGKLTEPQQKTLAENYAKFALKKKIGDSKRVVSRIKVPPGKIAKISDNPYLNKNPNSLNVFKGWSAKKLKDGGALKLQNNKKGEEDANPKTYYIRFDDRNGATHISTNKSEVVGDDSFKSEANIVTGKQALEWYGLPGIKDRTDTAKDTGDDGGKAIVDDMNKLSEEEKKKAAAAAKKNEVG